MLIKSQLAALACALLLASCPYVTQGQDAAQQQKPEALRLVSAAALRGKELLEQGDAEGAAKVLGEALRRNERDSAAWRYLGLALAREGKPVDARKALGRAVDLSTNAFNMELNMQLRQGVEPSKEESEARRLRFAAMTKENVESVESYIGVARDEEEFWHAWLKTLRLYSGLATDPKFDSEPFTLNQFATRAVITYKTEPRFPEEARQRNTQGKVSLRVMLDADGTVSRIAVAKSLGNGLDESSVAAARQIRFKPATLNGQPVAQLVIVEYGFEIH